MNIRSPETRRYLYGVALALIPVLVLFGLISPDDVATWTNLAGALLGLGAAGLALPNTPTAGGKHRASPPDVADEPTAPEGDLPGA